MFCPDCKEGAAKVSLNREIRSGIRFKYMMRRIGKMGRREFEFRPLKKRQVENGK